jgi:membrane complex biogenesis BtpA family protein
MVHLPPLPGAPRFDGDRAAIHETARRDAMALAAGGVDAVLVENYGDAPFYPDDVPKSTVAEMTTAVSTVREAVDVPVGVNVLRNDVRAALSVAGAAGGAFVRANVHTGTRATDQGLVSGRAHETVRYRERHDVDAAILADVDVKHSAPLADRPLAERVADAVERGLADGLVVSGPATGEPADADALRAVADAAPAGTPVLLGSGVAHENARDLLAVADGAIVGTAFKRDGETTNPVAESRVRRLLDTIR